MTPSISILLSGFKVILITGLFLFSHVSKAQVYSDKIVGAKHAERIDSLKESEYPYVLPIWGAKAVELGFDIPYSAGLGINFLTQKSEIEISNLQVGINNSQLFDLDEIVRFNSAIARSDIVNIRPDIWLFPFLNIYAIFAKSETSTEVDFSVWLPNGTNTEEIFNYRTTANFNATSTGFGITPTIGVGGGWMALDMNFTWTDIPELEKPAYSFVFGPRLGKSFNFKNPESNIAVWIGGFRVNLKSDTRGAIQLSEVLPSDGNLDGRIDTGLDKIYEKQAEVDVWWNSLSPAQQKINQPKYNLANSALAGANVLLTSIADAANNLERSTIQYSLDKKLKDKWNFIVGSQLQINKHWMVRAEIGFLGSRDQALAGLQYRFGL